MSRLSKRLGGLVKAIKVIDAHDSSLQLIDKGSRKGTGPSGKRTICPCKKKGIFIIF